MATFTQHGRHLTITSPLGEDVLLMAGFSGREEMSKPFLFQLDLVSENLTIAPPDIVGKPVTWTVFPEADAPRKFNGIVARWQAGPIDGRAGGPTGPTWSRGCGSSACPAIAASTRRKRPRKSSPRGSTSSV